MNDFFSKCTKIKETSILTINFVLRIQNANKTSLFTTSKNNIHDNISDNVIHPL